MPKAARSSAYDVLPTTRRFEPDLEKEPFRRQDSLDTDIEDDSQPSSDSSFRTSTSQQPMLESHSPRREKSTYFYRVPNRVTRRLCLGLLLFLVLFIITLIRLGHASAEQLELQIEKHLPSKKPPQWESFPFLKRYHGGIRTLMERNESTPEYPGDGVDDLILGDGESRDEDKLRFTSHAFNPYPNYSNDAYIKKFGKKKDCFLDEEETVSIPAVHIYDAIPRGFPEAVMGSNEMLEIKDDVCFDRFGRLGPYGYGYSLNRGGIGSGLEGHREGADNVWGKAGPVDFRDVDWAQAQQRCMTANSHRFRKPQTQNSDKFLGMESGAIEKQESDEEKKKGQKDQSNEEDSRLGPDSKRSASKDVEEPKRLPRTALIIRTWHDFRYTQEDILYLRALISELSLNSGGEYTIHFLVHVKDTNLPIWSDTETYDKILREALPKEFRGMGTLWSETQMSLMYPNLEETWTRGLPIHGVYRSTFMPIQYFAHQHPEYDYYWNWEMDVRYTGHFYHLFDKVGSWAKKQPRKGLWERNARFYVPEVHGSWDDFRQMVRVQTELGTNSPNNMWSPIVKGETKSKSSSGREGDKPVWGPERPDEDDIYEVDGEGIPPHSYEKDKYEWGVDEDADLIVFNPLYDPEGTTWLLRDDVTGYNKEDGLPPRRTAIITASRLSRKLLMTMHRETSLKHHSMFSEMWPASTALHHGFKAVYAPHSVYIDRRWPTDYLESVFNAGRNGASGGARTAVFGDREHNFRGTTWFYSAGFSPNLWRRWLGYRVDGDGGEEEEKAGEGRMCLPPMMLHPVKDVEMIVDGGGKEDDE
ncbi:hypothetical protein FQN54_002008 [Arachnomyces sp. PD_36]|nr:hypothetical protein FQN54_002008 [Arachnomyces sp. PD_36]